MEYYLIPSYESELELSNKLKKFVSRSTDDNELIIAGYSGHGRPTGPVRGESLQMYAHDNAGSSSLVWNRIQNEVLRPLLQDVLIIVDSCYAGNAFRGSSLGRKEILAASGTTSPAENGIKTKTSFTATLINHLKNMQQRQSIMEINARLTPMLAVSPFWTPIGGASNELIALRPIAASHAPTTMRHAPSTGIALDSHDLNVNIPIGIAKAESGSGITQAVSRFPGSPITSSDRTNIEQDHKRIHAGEMWQRFRGNK